MDSYAPCPCGSGKKVKFCCQPILGEMEKIERLLENNQPHMALQQLEKLDKAHPGNPWVVTRQALTYINDGRPAEAERALRPFLKAHPDHALANVLYGIASFNAQGYPEARRAVHRAFRKGAAQESSLVSSLAASIAGWYLSDGRPMAARQHMALALRLGSPEQRKQAFGALLELDGDPSVSYPLRGAHQPPVYVGPDSHKDQARKAQQLSIVGCWQEGAELLEGVAAVDNESAELWHLVGLFRVWDGMDDPAAEALHKAADRYQDFEQAVECETLAQLLEQFAPDRTRKMRVRQYRVESVSRLLTQLDALPQCVRVDRRLDEEATAGDPAARYLILDRPGRDISAATPETTPKFLARLAVFDRSEDDDSPAQAFLSGMEGAPLDAATQSFLAAAAGLASPEPLGDEPDADVTGLVPQEQVGLFQNFYFPAGMRGADRRRVQQEEWQTVINERWPNTPLRALGGKTPVEAASDPELRVALAGAIDVLDVFCAARSYILPVNELRSRFGLPPVAPLAVGAELNLNTLSFMQLKRLDLQALGSEQLQQVVQRAMLMRHPGVVRDVLTHAIESGVLESQKIDPQQAYSTLADIHRDALQPEQALEWIARGREAAQQATEHRFERTLQWRMREMTVRVDDPEDPATSELLRDMWQTYGSKLPWMRDQLNDLVGMLQIDPPWGGVVVSSSVAEDAGNWSPAESSAGGEKKLWLPGDA
jgi:tetratricopeptide (TPR) repeat protein